MGRVKKKKQTVEAHNSRGTEGDGGSGRWWYIWAALVAVVSVLVMLTYSITLLSSRTTTITSTTTPPAAGDVTHSPWKISGEVGVKVLSSPDASFARSCMKARVPLILRNSVVTRWQAHKKWSLDYLGTKLSSLRGIYENDNRWFGPYFDRTKPLLEHAIRKNPYKTNVELSSEEFFRRLQNPSADRFHYFSGDIDQLGDWAYSEVQPLRELLLPNPSRSSVNAWIGQPHVMAHCHYDGYHNFYAQLYGTKRFVLFSPVNWPGLYPYPFLHPSHAQAQVNTSSEEEVERFGLARRVEGVVATLHPGDLLYLPPLWFHEVESLGVSISVNVWTDSQQTELVERIFSLPLPLDYAEPSSHKHEHAQWRDIWERRVAAAVVILRLLQHVCQHLDCTSPNTDKFLDPDGNSRVRRMDPETYFVRQLWSTRYQHLMEGGELPEAYHQGEHILCEGGGGDGLDDAVVSVSQAVATDVHYGAYFEQVSQLVRGLPTETWQLWVGNYVEYVVASAVGEVEYVGLFLKHFSSCTKFLPRKK